MKRLNLIFCAIVLFLTLGACSLDDDGANFHYEPLQITNVELPESFDLNEVYNIKVKLLRPDDCTLIEGFDVTRGDLTTRNIVAIGAILDNKDCIALNQEVEDSFRFEVLYNDTYLFRFYSGEDENGEPQYIDVEIPVN